MFNTSAVYCATVVVSAGSCEDARGMNSWLMTPRSFIEGINHADDVAVAGMPAVDGLVAILTVSILATPET